jgi:hypothetical protein
MAAILEAQSNLLLTNTEELTTLLFLRATRSLIFPFP